jgi:plastocyanin
MNEMIDQGTTPTQTPAPVPEQPAPNFMPNGNEHQTPPNGKGPDKLFKIVIVTTMAILIIAVIALAFTGHHNKSASNASKTVAEQPESGKQTESDLRNFKHEVTVEITADGITPQALNIQTDTRINWENKDSVAHKLAITPGTTAPAQFDDGHQIVVGGGYPFVVHQTGTFHYYLTDRQTQGGTIVVK